MALDQCGVLGSLTVNDCLLVAEACLENATSAQEDAWETIASGCVTSADCDAFIACYESLPCYESNEEGAVAAALGERIETLRSSPDL